MVTLTNKHINWPADLLTYATHPLCPFKSLWGWGTKITRPLTDSSKDWCWQTNILTTTVQYTGQYLSSLLLDTGKYYGTSLAWSTRHVRRTWTGYVYNTQDAHQIIISAQVLLNATLGLMLNQGSASDEPIIDYNRWLVGLGKQAHVWLQVPSFQLIGNMIKLSHVIMSYSSY